MGYVLIVLLVSLISFLTAFTIEREDKDLRFLIGVLFAIIAIIVMIIPMAILGGILNASSPTEKYTYSETHMVVLKDNIETNGKFFLGSGRVDSEMQYYYMVNTNKGMQVRSVSAESSYLVESNDIQPMIVENRDRFKNKKLQLWFPARNNSEIIIYVPKGSVDYSYRVDLE